jgi:DNA-directed RNA polymerase specialized sigma24 family protein
MGTDSLEFEQLCSHLRSGVPTDLSFLADDLVQESLLRLFTSTQTNPPIRCHPAWARGILRCLILDCRRRNRIETAVQRVLSRAQAINSREPSVIDEEHSVEEHQHLMTQLLNLRGKARAMQRFIIDEIVEGRDPRHTARSRGIRVANLERALDSLCRHLLRAAPRSRE